MNLLEARLHYPLADHLPAAGASTDIARYPASSMRRRIAPTTDLPAVIPPPAP